MRKNRRRTKVSKKNAFSLLELFLSLALVSMGASLLTMQGLTLIRSKELSYSQHSCQEIINFCKLSSSSRRQDLLLYFSNNSSGCLLEVRPFWQKNKRNILYKKLILPKTKFSYNKMEKGSILFSPTGAIEPPGTILLSYKGKEKELSVGSLKNLE